MQSPGWAGLPVRGGAHSPGWSPLAGGTGMRCGLGTAVMATKKQHWNCCEFFLSKLKPSLAKWFGLSYHYIAELAPWLNNGSSTLYTSLKLVHTVFITHQGKGNKHENVLVLYLYPILQRSRFLEFGRLLSSEKNRYAFLLLPGQKIADRPGIVLLLIGSKELTCNWSLIFIITM